MRFYSLKEINLRTGTYTNFSNYNGVVYSDTQFFVKSPKSFQNTHFSKTPNFFDTPFFDVCFVPFGQVMPNRHGNDNQYRYGYNGKEKTDEWSGDGNSYDFGARMYDSRIGRFLSRDPREDEFPYMTPYCFAANSPIMFTDENGEGPGDRVRVAKEMVQNYKANGTKYSQPKREFGKDVSFSDCSSFVESVLRESGHKDLFKTEYTGHGADAGFQGEIKKMSGAKNLKDPYTLKPKAGDIAMWGGHVAIVTSVDEKSVKIAMMGNSGANEYSVPLKNGAVDMSDASIVKKMNGLGGGGFWGFWSPEASQVASASEKNKNITPKEDVKPKAKTVKPAAVKTQQKQVNPDTKSPEEQKLEQQQKERDQNLKEIEELSKDPIKNSKRLQEILLGPEKN